jgi:hypothetical protein
MPSLSPFKHVNRKERGTLRSTTEVISDTPLWVYGPLGTWFGSYLSIYGNFTSRWEIAKMQEVVKSDLLLKELPSHATLNSPMFLLLCADTNKQWHSWKVSKRVNHMSEVLLFTTLKTQVFFLLRFDVLTLNLIIRKCLWVLRLMPSQNHLATDDRLNTRDGNYTCT